MTSEKARYVVVLRRQNGRFVKSSRPFRSRYAAKQFSWIWEEKYDEKTYFIDIERTEESSDPDSGQGDTST